MTTKRWLSAPLALVSAAMLASGLIVFSGPAAQAEEPPATSTSALTSSTLDVDDLEAARDALAATDPAQVPRISYTSEDGVAVTRYELAGIGYLVLPDGELDSYFEGPDPDVLHPDVSFGIGANGPYMDLNEADVNALLAGGSAAFIAALCGATVGTFCAVAPVLVAIAFSYANDTACKNIRVWLAVRNPAGGTGYPVCLKVSG